jgi:cytochrome c-type biogenesis protein CcmH
MTLLLYAIAAIMIATALVLLLRPLLRRRRGMVRSRGSLWLASAIVLALPLATIGVYALVGTPAALDTAVRLGVPASLPGDIAELNARVERSPQDLQSWLQLGRSYEAMQQPRQAIDAYDQVLGLDPTNVEARVAWVAVDSMLKAGHVIDGTARALLEQALADDPQNQRGLWLLGVSDFQAGNFSAAVATWNRLLSLLEPGSTMAAAVQQQISMAQSRLPATGTGLHLEVVVHLAPSLEDKRAGDDTLYVFARDADGSGAPLAVAKLVSPRLPTTVVLTNGMGMSPGLTLPAANRIVLTARISKHGQALPRPGDLEGNAGPLDVHTRGPTEIVINRAR